MLEKRSTQTLDHIYFKPLSLMVGGERSFFYLGFQAKLVKTLIIAILF